MLKLFISLYVIGIVSATVTALSGGQTIVFGYIFAPDFSHYILPLGLIHMLLLILVGYRVSPKDREAAGTRIQTAGYLHTLIGFSAALLHISGEAFSIAEIMAPLGSALMTSILGWFAGGELSSKSTGTLQHIAGEMGDLGEELKSFTEAVKMAHHSYLLTLNGTAEEHAKLLEKQKEIIDHSTTGLAESNKVLGQISDTSSKLSRAIDTSFGENLRKATHDILENSKHHAASLKQAAAEAGNSQKYLSESRVLISELEKLLEMISSLKRPVS